jgi:RNA polymerase subunit RPABC4/transcription elongation factor Spt4
MHCRDCGATVDRADRFCPACGTPNAATKFHPKFGPMPQEFEAEILYEVASADEPACLRCERRIGEGSRWCEGCGHDLRESWRRYRHRVAVGQWERLETVPRPFRPAGGVGRALRGVLAGSTVAALGLATVDGGAVARVGVVADARALAGPVTAGLITAAAVLVHAWFVRTLGNLPALGVVDRRRGPSRVLDAVIPRRVLDDLWRASAEDLEPCSPGWRRGPRSALSGLWWGSAGTGAALAAASAMTAPSAPINAWLTAGAAGVLAGSALTLVVLTRRIEQRQARRAAALTARPRGVDVGDEVCAPVGRVAVELTASVPTRLEPLRTVAPDRRTTALNRPPSARRPVWGKY